MVAQNGGRDVLIAYQPVGPNIERLVTLKDTYPDVHFSCVVDNETTIQSITNAATKYKLDIDLYLDIDNGMHRTVVADLTTMQALVEQISHSPGVTFAGLHVYDGHIHEPDLQLREQQCLADFEIVNELIGLLNDQNIIIPNLITGGTPTFPIHAQFKNRQLSPGTPLLWDNGYGEAFKDLPFKHAAVVMSRVISRPPDRKVCLDLGYKSIASEMSHPRVFLLNVDDYHIKNHSEEHMVLQFNHNKIPQIGDIIYGIPTHICPTVALYEDAYIIDNHEVIDKYTIQARKRTITV